MKIISAIVGIILLTVSLTLAYLSNKNGNQIIANQNAIIEKYINSSKEALNNGNINDAIKFAKKAIAVDPKNKEAFKAYENIIESKYKPAEDTNVDSTPAPATTAPASFAPAYDDDDMGC